MKMIKKKKIIKLSKLSKLKKKLKLHYEKDYYFIGFKLINLKTKKKPKSNTVKYLKTTWYVIPLPSEEEYKVKKWKILLLIKTNLQSVYKYYDEFFEWQLYLSNYSFITNYNPGRLGYLTKFDNNLKLEILLSLNNVFWLFVECSFSKNYLWKYYSKKKFKYYSQIFFWDMFEYYRNPNLPLKRQKGERYLTRTQGNALIQAKEIIFRELTMENLGIPHFFSDLEIKIFWKAGIDPFDKRYHWPTRRLFILNISKHDGRIIWFFSTKPQIKIKKKKNYNLVPLSGSILINLKKKFLFQIYFWKKLFLELLLKKNLFFNLKVILGIIFSKNKIYFLPSYYYGFKNEFLKMNFFTKFVIFNDKYIYSNLSWVKLLHSILNLKKFNFFKLRFWFFLKKNQNPSKRTIHFFYNNKLKVLNIKNELSFSSTISWKNKNKKNFYFIPLFFKKIFYLLFFKNNKKFFMFEEILFYKFITKLYYFSDIKNKSFFVKPFKTYFDFASKYNLSDPTLAYWIMKINMLKLKNKNSLILRQKQYGLNPFYKFSKILSSKDVVFTDSINSYNYFKFLKKINLKKINLKKINLKKINFFFNFLTFSTFSTEKVVLALFNTITSFFLFNSIFKKFFKNRIHKKKESLALRICLFLKTKNSSLIKKNIQKKIYKKKLNYIDFFNDALLELKLYPNGRMSPLLASLKPPKKNDIASKKLYWIQSDYLQRWADKSKTYYLINTMYPLLQLNFFLWNQFVTNSVTFLENYQNIFYIQSLNVLQGKFFFLSNNFSLYSESFYHYIRLYYCIKHIFITLPPFVNLKLKNYV